MVNAKEKRSNLEQFLTDVEEFVTDFTAKAIDVADDEDEIAVMKSLAPTIQSQFRELNVYVREKANKATKQELKEIEDFLRLSAASDMLKNARGILPSIGSIAGKFGIVEIIRAVKKILERLFPKWFQNPKGFFSTLLLIIDELIDMFFSGGSLKVATALSTLEQNFLNELAALANLQNARAAFDANEEDDEF